MLGSFRLVVAPRELGKRGGDPDDLLLADLHAAAEPVMRRLGALAGAPGVGVDVHVEGLEPHRGDQVVPAGEDTRSLRTPDRLAAAEGHERGALGAEAPE